MGQSTLLCECGVNKVRPSFGCSTPLPPEWERDVNVRACTRRSTSRTRYACCRCGGRSGGCKVDLSVFDRPCAIGSQSHRPTVFLQCYLATQQKWSACLYLTRCRTLAEADPLLNCLAKESRECKGGGLASVVFG